MDARNSADNRRYVWADCTLSGSTARVCSRHAYEVHDILHFEKCCPQLLVSGVHAGASQRDRISRPISRGPHGHGLARSPPSNRPKAAGCRERAIPWQRYSNAHAKTTVSRKCVVAAYAAHAAVTAHALAPTEVGREKGSAKAHATVEEGNHETLSDAWPEQRRRRYRGSWHWAGRKSRGGGKVGKADAGWFAEPNEGTRVEECLTQPSRF